MKAIQTGNAFHIYDNSMKTYDQLPPNAYLINFSKDTGFFLTLYSDININEKVYGVHEAKVNKVLNAFNSFGRNLGIILSGDKGIGKSLFSKMLAQRGIEQGLPLIIANAYIPGIGEYINSIEQEVIVLFDEFDKTFQKCGDRDPQAEMLTLFDGIAQGKKLFVVTCNDLRGLNNFLVNRPGRFHYHLRFEYPNAAAITEYLTDALDEKYHKEIPAVIAFSGKVDLNYDCLRAIAFELNCGLSFRDAIADLNIINLDADYYTLVLVLSNGEELKITERLDSFSSEETYSEFYDPEMHEDLYYVHYTPSSNHYDTNSSHCCIEADDLRLELQSHINPKSDDEDYKKLYQKYKDVKAVRLELRRQKSKSIHYLVQRQPWVGGNINPRL